MSTVLLGVRRARPPIRGGGQGRRGHCPPGGRARAEGEPHGGLAVRCHPRLSATTRPRTDGRRGVWGSGLRTGANRFPELDTVFAALAEYRAERDERTLRPGLTNPGACSSRAAP